MIKQITVFLENREGRLAALSRCLADADVNMYALSIAETTDYGLVRIICNDPAHALEVLQANDYRAMQSDVSAFEVPNRPGGLAELFEVLNKLNLNIEYGYCFSISADMAPVVLKIHDAANAKEAAAALEAAGFKAFTQEELQ